MIGNLTGAHLLIVLGIVVLLFGATKLPALARGVGRSVSVFRRELRGGGGEASEWSATRGQGEGQAQSATGGSRSRGEAASTP